MQMLSGQYMQVGRKEHNISFVQLCSLFLLLITILLDCEQMIHSTNCPSPAVFSYLFCRARITLVYKCSPIGDNQTFTHNQRNVLFTICLSLIHDLLDLSDSQHLHCLSNLLTNIGNFVAHPTLSFDGHIEVR